MKYDVFISYSSVDQKVAEGVCGYLESQGIRCFVAYRDIPRGVVWAAAIVDALDDSQMMVVIFSDSFNKSKQVDREIELASENEMPILPFRISDSGFSGVKKYYLKNLNWIDAFPDPQEVFGFLCDNVKRLIAPQGGNGFTPSTPVATRKTAASSMTPQLVEDKNEFLSTPMQDLQNTPKSTNSTQQTNTTENNPDVDYWAELESLVGLERVKQYVDSLRNLIKIQKMYGLPKTLMLYHCVFSGNPGTGKTTVARILAGIYKELGILKKGHLVVADRFDLVGEYVGQTAQKTDKVIDEALDGVLFIDEAYSLMGEDNDYGAVVIETLLEHMEYDRDRLVVILAGYKNEMEVFINSNPDLQSRFRYIQFDDYSTGELTEIFIRNLQKSGYKIMRDAFEELQTVIERAVASRDRNFGNARYVCKLFEKVVQNQAYRLAKMNSIDNNELSMITREDINF